jgi:hypothetical protein
LNTVVREGTPSRRQILEGHRKQLLKQGKPQEFVAAKFKELEPVALEPNTRDLLDTFETLSGTRDFGVAGPQPITYSEMKAFVELTGTELSPWEVATIKAMDRAYVEEVRNLSKEQ